MENRAVDRPPFLLRAVPAVCLLLLVALLFNGYYLSCGFMGEDFMFLNMMREEPRPVSRLLGFWATTDYPAITSIWWFEGQGISPFWRPLPALVIEGSVMVFGENRFPLHLLFVLVHGLVGGTIFLLVRRLSGRPFLALVAGLFFLTCEDHAMAVGWIAAGTDLMCALFLILGLIAHVIWLDRRRAWALAASIFALAAALLSKESAVVGPPAVCLLTLLMPSGHDRQPAPASLGAARDAGRRFLRDWASWVPAVVLLGAYLSTYKLIGIGGFTSGMYVDPLSNPGAYLAHVAGHLPILWLATLSPVPPSITMFFPGTLPVLAAAGAALFLAWLLVLRRLRRSALVIWSVAFYLIALLPQMAADASERALYLPMIGASVPLALVAMQIGPLARRLRPEGPLPGGLARAAAWWVIFCVLLPGVVLSPTMSLVYGVSFEKPNRETATLIPHIEQRRPDHLFVLNTSGPIHTFYLHPFARYHGGADLDVRVLSAVNAVMSVERTGERSFIVRADRGGWLTNVFSGMLRGRRAPRPGRSFRRGILTATYAEMTAGGRDILGVRFDLELPLSDPRVLFVRWDGTAFRPMDLQALPIGEKVTLADTSDVWASMW